MDNIIGKKFGRLTVLQRLGLRMTSKNKKSTFVLCQCDCGNTCEVRLTYLNIGKTKSCGCYRNERVSQTQKKDLTNKRFGKLLVIKESGRTKLGSVLWRCECDCGQVRIIDGHSLRRGSTQSCGCKVFEKRKRGKESPLWNPNISDQERINRRSIWGVIEWRKLVYERDKYCCRRCRCSQGGNLNAHHLNSWNTHPQERFDISNGITLCETCHNEFHKAFGYGNNTKTQFNEFLLG